MPPNRGEWTHNGSAAGLRRLAVETKAAGNTALLAKTRRELTKAAVPAREAVQRMERAVLPKEGGLNEWVASTPVRVSVLTGPKTAGVSLRQSKRGRTRPHDLRRMNDFGIVRHPVFADPDKERKQWTWVAQSIPKGWWDAALIPDRVEVTARMLAVLHETGYEAGFR
jgi:hypothetical protein